MNSTSTVKNNSFYMPAEWHPHERCWMAWPCHKETWSKIGLERARKAYALVAKAISAFEPLTMIANPDDSADAQSMCGSGIEVISWPLNDSWTRDTGPTFLLNNDGQLAGIDWIHNAWGGNYQECHLDNALALKIIKATQAHYIHAPLVMEGGSFHVDGEGTVLTTRECLLHPNRNPTLSQNEIEAYLLDYLGCKEIIWLNKGLLGDETDGHIDELATFIAPGEVLCLISEDKNDPNYERLQENLSILKAARDAKGRTLEVHTVVQPPETVLDGERLTLSYVNFYHANKAIVMPSFGYKTYDENAYVLFKKLFPAYKITQVEALDIFTGGGGIHCITQQQPKSRKHL